ncbi:MAG: aminoglycoside phosphotransferase family protein [Anaerolineae bacterium]|nr:aminoglycoside phosphotransferase family protein [Anaerolineae bacterium]
MSASALSPAQKESAINAVRQLPTGNKLCHGDFHPDNILMSTRGAVTIDWTTANMGNPLADLARSSLILQLGDLPPGTPAMTRWMVSAGRRLFHKTYLKHYFELRPENQEQFVAWRTPTVAARLGDGIPEEKEQLLSLLAL